MKKILALVLCLAMLVGCVSAMADETVNVHFTETSYGRLLSDLMLKLGYDEDDCAVIDLSGIVDGEVAFFLQLDDEGEAITFSIDGQTLTITAETLGQVLGELAAVWLEEQGVDMNELAAALQVIENYLENGLESDLAIAEGALAEAANGLAMLAYQYGILNLSEQGDVTIAATDDTLIAFAGDFLTALASGTVVDTLATTQLWGLLELSRDGSAEKAALAQAGAQLKAMADNETEMQFELDIKAEGYGTFYFVNSEVAIEGGFNGENVHASITDGETTVNFTIAYTGFGFEIVDGEDRMLFDLVYADNVILNTVDAYIDGESITMEYNADLTAYTVKSVVTLNGEPVYVYDLYVQNGVLYIEVHATEAYNYMFADGESVFTDAYFCFDTETLQLDATILNGETEMLTVNGAFADNGVYTLTMNAMGETVTIELFAETDAEGYTVYNARLLSEEGQDVTLKLKYLESDNGFSVVLGEYFANIALEEIRMDLFLTDEVFSHVNGYMLSAQELEMLLAGF